MSFATQALMAPQAGDHHSSLVHKFVLFLSPGESLSLDKSAHLHWLAGWLLHSHHTSYFIIIIIIVILGTTGNRN